MTQFEDERAVRCFGGPGDPLMMRYHDEEWGVPVHDDCKLLEFLLLDGAQAGLSWRTILHKREAYRAAFDGFDATRIAAYTDTDRQRLLANDGIVRNRRKIDAFITNTQCFLGGADSVRNVRRIYLGLHRSPDSAQARRADVGETPRLGRPNQTRWRRT